MKFNLYQKLCALYFVAIVIYWIALSQTSLTSSYYNFGYSLAFTFIPFIGGLIGIAKAKIWGGFKSTIGKAVSFFSIGLFLWGCGNLVWAYYNFVLGVAAPYPSWADLGFAPSILFWVIGAVFLSKATGAKFQLRKTSGKLGSIVLFTSAAALSYYMLIIVARGGVITTADGGNLKLILDIAYPLGDFLAFTVASLVIGLSLKYFGGTYAVSIISTLMGLGVMFIGDFIFSYTTTAGTFYNGSFGDLILTIGLFLITFGVLGFVSKPKTLAGGDHV